MLIFLAFYTIGYHFFEKKFYVCRKPCLTGCSASNFMHTEYLERIRIYLQQEMPVYKADMTLENGVLVFGVPDGKVFQPYYDAVFAAASACISRLRNQEIDLAFSVKSPNRERDFHLVKPVGR